MLRVPPTLTAAAARGLGGLGFALGSLLLARALPKQEFALAAIALALSNLAIPLAPLGADGVANRRGLAATPQLLGRGLLTSALAALGAAAIGALAYPLGAALLAVIGLGVLGGGAAFLAAACLQARRRFGPALAVSEQTNWTLALAAGVALAWRAETALTPLVIVCGGQLLAAALGWARLLRERDPPDCAPYPWPESLALAGMSAVVVLLLQLERLLIPRLLGLEALAAYAVLAAVAIAPFRMLQNGVSFALLPRLRRAEPAARARLLAGEAALVLGVAAAASVAVVALGPWVVELAVGARYELAPSLFAAALAAGFVRVATAFADATATALAPPRGLAVLNAAGALAVPLSVAGAVVGAQLGGLSGVLYGTSVGWAARALLGAALAAPHVRSETCPSRRGRSGTRARW